MKKCLLISLLLSQSLYAYHIDAIGDELTTFNTSGYDVFTCNYKGLSLINDYFQHNKDLSKIENELENSDLKNEVEKSIKCISLVNEYGIKKVPAIIIDKKYIAYGETDISKAVVDCRDKGVCDD